MSPHYLLPAAIVIALAQVALPARGKVDAPMSCPPPAPLRIPEASPETGSGRTNIDAERFDASRQDEVRFRDSVLLRQGQQELETDELIYEPQTGRVRIPGWLQYSGPRLNVDAQSASYDTRRKSGQFESILYTIPGTTARGSAASAVIHDPEHARLETFDFTTCPPEQDDWQIEASSVDMDMEKGVGTARNARLVFKGVPLLYSPWLSFPLDDRRKSGFLYPGFGYSADDGFDVSIPWYWNIAPNQDATITARWIEKRGPMLGLEHRFLTERQSGELRIDWLPEDKRTNDGRYYGEFDYRLRAHPGWVASANLKRASDDEYFIDLGSDLRDSAIQFLRSSASLRGFGRYWSLEVLADTFQVLDESVGPTREPYRRLPRTMLDVDRPLPGRFRFSLDGEAVYFDRDVGVTGARVDLFPRLHYDLVAPGWHIRPAVGVRSTAYELDGGADSSLTRTTPIATFDAGLAFERRLDSGRIQTLEPRFYYLYVPYRDQDDYPDFDTRELTFGFSQLFHYNRFSGPDRQGDANQLTLALTSRLLEVEDGFSRLEASLGQIVYFRDLRVQLDEAAPDMRERSATVAEMTWRPARQLVLNAGLQWDDEADETEVARFGLNWQGRDARQVALGYRFRRDRVDQADMRFRYPVNQQLNLVGRVTYSFEENETLEVLGGIEYDSCCWSLRFTAREWVRDRESDKRTAFFVELELKGLGSVGRSPYRLFTGPTWQ
ncbi:MULTISPECIES: LPS-assembly protein LptD [unclassified Wenzhouxiangella]|uniref:LPS-assembly protein LptD n=1 Tax=unclassified Wenzhouxiangella TaxID=2613841 RepID=UPI000E32A653|nr:MULTISPECIES: LPS assembly protein LptD [unclassified Wenzhouxiangella]RFF27230.1 LPS-assembly protein LptD [Wenzhouxiangella sp. 15181]RFP69714.1 LPS-assembly protein LptD [Wenzhouxiangella sp. 15190]